MNAVMRKTSALLTKDFKDVVKNPTMLICTLLPIGFIWLYSQMGSDTADAQQREAMRTYLLSMAFCMAAGMVGSMTILTAIAEEKEKHTLRTLMLANVSAGQILASRAAVAFVSLIIVNVACYFLLDSSLSKLTEFLVIGLLGSVPIMLIALLLGLSSRDQMTAGLYSVPVVLIAFLPAFSAVNEVLGKIAPYFPTGGADKLLRLAMQDSLFTSEALQPLLITLAWIVVTAVGFTLVYKRLARDN
ncbi:ABC transporter permease [Eggerthella sp. YY7918]|uniref:ABC transporter permease n=1 Tax=Eggerthella sp. (strain YY7918) TaxID=502558 RepID=UPI0002171289|nr:ABC transporter permease [Eggerthella sp. YY7918]BAK45279.1 hypothetical protein EGYY_21900 [Eggerthella sp. YY7918]